MLRPINYSYAVHPLHHIMLHCQKQFKATIPNQLSKRRDAFSTKQRQNRKSALAKKREVARYVKTQIGAATSVKEVGTALQHVCFDFHDIPIEETIDIVVAVLTSFFCDTMLAEACAMLGIALYDTGVRRDYVSECLFRKSTHLLLMKYVGTSKSCMLLLGKMLDIIPMQDWFIQSKLLDPMLQIHGFSETALLLCDSLADSHSRALCHSSMFVKLSDELGITKDSSLMAARAKLLPAAYGCTMAIGETSQREWLRCVQLYPQLRFLADMAVEVIEDRGGSVIAALTDTS